MNHIPHHSNNALGQDGQMTVTVMPDTSGVLVAVTFWEPTEEERAAIAAGAPIALGLRVPHGVPVNAVLTVDGQEWARFDAPPALVQ